MNLKRAIGISPSPHAHDDRRLKREGILKLFINLTNSSVSKTFNNLNILTASRCSINIFAYIVLFIN